MKSEISKFVSKYLVCQQINAKHQIMIVLLRHLPIPKWKWKRVIIYFITVLPHSPKVTVPSR